MDILTVAFIFIIIIFGIVGYFKGFLSSLSFFLRGIGCAIIAFLLCKPLGNFLNSIPNIHNFFFNPIFEWLRSIKNGSFDIIISSENQAALQDYVQGAGLMDFIKTILISLLKNDNNIGKNLCEVITNKTVVSILISLSYLTIFVICRIICIFLKLIGKKISADPVVGMINRILGVFICVLESFVFIIFINVLFYVIINMNIGTQPFLEFIKNNLYAHIYDDKPWTLAKFIYNFIARFINN